MGFAASAFFGPAMADISNYFNKQRGFALSFVASANYVAGATWPLLIGYFLKFLDWRTTHFWISICLLIKGDNDSYCSCSVTSKIWAHSSNSFSSDRAISGSKLKKSQQ